MTTNQQAKYFISSQVRWLAIVTGCFASATGLPAFGWLFPIFPIPLIIGAIVQPRARRSGAWLMWVGGLLSSLIVLPYGVALSLDAKRILHSYHDGVLIGTLASWIISVILVLCNDIALVFSALKPINDDRLKPQSPQRNLDWVVWIAALVLTSYILLIRVHTLQSGVFGGRIADLLIWAGLCLVVLLFDLGLAVKALRKR